MPRVVDKPGVPQASAVDRLVEKLSLPAAEILQRATYETVVGNYEAANAAWVEYEQKLAKNSFVMLLAGHAAVVKRLKRRKLTPPRIRPTTAKFSIEIQSRKTLPFLEAARMFSKDIPEVEGLVEELIRAANQIASAYTEKEMATAPRAMVKRIVDALQKAAPTAAEGSVLTYADPEAVAAAIQSSLGFKVAQDRMATDYRTALMDSFNAGSYQRMQESKAVIPVYMLSEIKDRRTRGNPHGLYPDAGPHYQMDGFCAVSDDPIWGLVWPPNGYNCRADVIALTYPECQKRGWIKDDGTLDRQKIHNQFVKQRRFVESGEYPDKGFAKNTAMRLGLVA